MEPECKKSRTEGKESNLLHRNKDTIKSIHANDLSNTMKPRAARSRTNIIGPIRRHWKRDITSSKGDKLLSNSGKPKVAVSKTGDTESRRPMPNKGDALSKQLIDLNGRGESI